MFVRKRLCSLCETGKESYELDPTAVECPYMVRNNGKTCPNFVKLKKSKTGFFEKIGIYLSKSWKDIRFGCPFKMSDYGN